jgi:hypothetical protein
MAQAHYGAAFTGRNLPANWSSTENALEKQAFAAKDAVLTVDDFAPTGTTHDVARLHRTADRFLRAQGNRAGRGRMRADTTLRAEYYPRGLVLSSGEDVPRGQSLRARVAVLELSEGDVDLALLTEMQRAAAEGLLASAMSAYLRWLAPRVDDLKEGLPGRHRELREKAAGAGTHARTPDIVASLGMGMETILEFAAEAGAITGARAEQLWEEAWEALGEMAKAQLEHQGGEEPTQRFLELLTAMIVSGGAYIADAKTGREPDNAERWGWRDAMDELRPQGKMIGWLKDDESVLLEPGAAFAAAQKMAREQGTSLTVGLRTLWKRLKEKGLLPSWDESRGRNTTRAKIAGERKVVVHLIPGLLSEIGPIGPNGPKPTKRGGSGPKVGADSSAPEAETAPQTGPNPPETGPEGPKGPKGPFPEGGPTEKVGRAAHHRLPDGEAHLVYTHAGVQELLPELREVECVALDLETTGLDPRKDRIRLLTLATEGGTWIVDCFKVDPHPLFPILAEKKLVIHNAIFDLSFLYQMDFEVGEGGEALDTMLTSQLLGVEETEDKESV